MQKSRQQGPAPPDSLRTLNRNSRCLFPDHMIYKRPCFSLHRGFVAERAYQKDGQQRNDVRRSGEVGSRSWRTSSARCAPLELSSAEDGRCYWIVLATEENALFAFDPTRRIVPTTSTRITASITAYSAMSWPSSVQSLWRRSAILPLSTFYIVSGRSSRRCYLAETRCCRS